MKKQIDNMECEYSATMMECIESMKKQTGSMQERLAKLPEDKNE